MPLITLFYAKQFLTFFPKAAGKFNIMQFEHLPIKYSKKNELLIEKGYCCHTKQLCNPQT